MGSSRKGKHETAIIDEEDQVDARFVLADRSPEPLQQRPRARELDAEQWGLLGRHPPGGQQGCHNRPGFVGCDGRPMMHAQFLGLMVDPEDTPSAGFV
jgi:hypothetical protein